MGQNLHPVYVCLGRVYYLLLAYAVIREDLPAVVFKTVFRCMYVKTAVMIVSVCAVDWNGQLS